MLQNIVRVWMFRHGETDWNLQSRLQGHTDTSLNATGIEQARSLQQKFREINPQIVLSSDLQRAYETARIAYEGLGLESLRHSEFREASFGELEGLTREEIIDRYGVEAWKRWLSVAPEDLDFQIVKMESKRAVTERVLSKLQDVISARPELNRVILVTHGGVLRRTIHSIETNAVREISIHNCVGYELHFNRHTLQWLFKS